MYLDLSLSYVGMPEELTVEQTGASGHVAEDVNEIENGAEEEHEQKTASTEILPTQTEVAKQGRHSESH